MEFLNNSGANTIPMKTFNDHIQVVRNVINTSEYVYKDTTVAKKALISNPIPPRIYGLLKVHKDGMPIRPVVSCISTPTYQLAKDLDYWIKTSINHLSSRAVTSSLELVNKIKDIVPTTNATFISLDVSALFPSLPHEPTLQHLESKLTQVHMPTFIIKELMSLVRLCLNTNICKFNGQLYSFPHGIGVPMGSPLSSTLSEVFMEKLEEDIFNLNPELTDNITYWYRYVDDVICLWNGNTDKLTTFLNTINSLYPTIKFTIEFGGKMINFLDLSISIVDNQHTFGVYRKPTSTNILLNNNSFRPISHKLAALLSFIHRLVTLPLTHIEFEKELATIRYLAQTNNLGYFDIDNLVKKKLTRMALDSTTSLPRQEKRVNPRYISVPYLGKISQSLQKVMAQHNLRLAFYPLDSIRSHLSKLKDPIPREEKSGVYMLPCNDCASVYIGETGRRLPIRLHEHLEQPSQASSFRLHLFNHRHSFKQGTEVLLHTEDSLRRRLALESLESARYQHNGWNVLNYSHPSKGLIDRLYPSPHE